jgi:hypothetical protein
LPSLLGTNSKKVDRLRNYKRSREIAGCKEDEHYKTWKIRTKGKMMLILPQHLREKLREPLGKVVDEEGLLKELKGKDGIVSIGDLVTFTLLKNGISPIISIVDYSIERKESPTFIKERIEAFGKKVKVKNPRSSITRELWDAIDLAYKRREGGPHCIEIEGEEDLAALAAIFLAPSDATIIYGLPNKGIVVVKLDSKCRSKVKEILDEMGYHGDRNSIQDK